MSGIVKKVGAFAAQRAAATTDCACNQSGWRFVAQKAECLPNKWASARSEATEVVGRVKSGEATMGDLKMYAAYIIGGGMIFFVGEAVGRGSIVGYKG